MADNQILWLDKVNLKNIDLVGGKNASLGEMIGTLQQRGINVPYGFVVSVDAYWEFIEYNKLKDSILALLDKCDLNDVESLSRTGLHIRMLMKNGDFPSKLAEEIKRCYRELSQLYQQEATDVAVRSSATAEDLPDASFAGQQETYLNVRGDQEILTTVRNCFASLFTDRAISYRTTFGFEHMHIGLAVGVQKMVRSDLGSSGVAFSLDTESGFRDVVLINGTFGLGELVVRGSVSPDEFLVFKPTLMQGSASIIEKKRGLKTTKMTYGMDPDQRVKVIPTERAQRNRFCLTDDQVLQLAKWVVEIEQHYSEKNNRWCPMDIEWALDGLSSELFIVQARPETVHSRVKEGKIVEYKIEEDALEQKLLTQGVAVGDKIASGKVRILYNLDGRDGSMDGKSFQRGEVLVTDMTDPDWEPIMKKASAIITNKGGRTCHAAIVTRELGIPAIVGTNNGADTLINGQLVTVSCAEGDIGKAYAGEIKYSRIETNLLDIPETRVPIMLNVGSPETAFSVANYPHRGVGLAREEFIINNYIQCHPLALLKHREMEDPELTRQIETLIDGFENESDFFIKKLSYGIGRIGAAFYPHKVIVRFSDFKSNEYANLLGGKYFEPVEENPMIGWRGASRYYSSEYKQAFGLECKAIKHVRETMGLKNVIVMIPFCRTVEECQNVLATMAEFDLVRGQADLEVYLMAELPSNIIMAEEFAEHVDGFSIGSNDLTQLTLGIDRDSSLIAHLYNERNPAVKRMLHQLISVAKAKGKKVGICGQGPSDFPDFAQFLVQEGIDSISVTPDSLLKTARAIKEIESSSA
ncbi:MAG: phosphoenolpyruvate synthase [Bdellovibrionales bacterium]|nr:phosphoenolpyruvate synthase [Bdellovibrionales bacterium]